MGADIWHNVFIQGIIAHLNDDALVPDKKRRTSSRSTSYQERTQTLLVVYFIWTMIYLEALTSLGWDVASIRPI